MATRRRKKRPAKRGRRGGDAGQKILVAASSVVLVLCAASVTWSFFVRRGGGQGESGRTFTIAVLNGTGQRGLAHEAKRGLLRRGIDVIEVGNAPRFDYRESVLIARKRDVDVTRLGEALGCRNVIVQIKEDAIEDASLILGADYRSLDLEWDGD